MAEGDDTTPIGNFVPLVAPGPSGNRPPDVALPGDNTPVGSFKPLLSTSFEKVPSKDNGSGSVWGDIERNLGLGTRNVIEGVTALPGQIADVATYPGRWLNRQIGLPTTAPSDLINKGLDATGLPAAQTDEEKRNAEIIRGGAAMLTPMGLALGAPGLVSKLPAVVRPLIGTNQITPTGAATQVVAGGVGAGVGDAAANSEYVPEWLKPTARLVGNIAGAGGTSLVHDAAGTLINAAKGAPTEIAQALARLGITPRTAGAVSERPGVQGTEGSLSRLAGASGVLRPAQQQTVDDFGRAVQTTASKLAPQADSPEATGTIVQKALQDWRTNVNPGVQNNAWAPLNQRMAGASVDPAPYRAALEYAASPPALASLPENQRAFASAQARKWLDALNSDAPPGTNLTWEQAHALKQRIGDAMGTPDIVNSIGDNQLKSMYGGLAEGMKNTAVQHGQGGLFDAANAVTMDAHQFIDGTLSKAISTNNPKQETIRPDAATNALLNDNTALQQLRDKAPDAADALAAWKLRQAALAKGSQQGASADETSTGSFLTGMANHKMARPEGFDALYSDPGVRSNVDDLMKVAEQLRQTERNVNVSGSGAAIQLATLGPQIVQAYQHGGMKAALATAGANWAVPNVGARVLTDPRIIKLMSTQPGPRLPMSGRVAGLLGAQATMPQDQGP